VKSVKELYHKIIPHFKKYPLLTSKNESFRILKRIVFLIYKKRLYNEKGLVELSDFSLLTKKEISKDLYISLKKTLLPGERVLKKTDITPE
jgi:hypothetical protein